MTSQVATELHAAHRYLTGVLLHLSIDSENMTARRLIELIEYFHHNPTEYINLINEE